MSPSTGNGPPASIVHVPRHQGRAFTNNETNVQEPRWDWQFQSVADPSSRRDLRDDATSLRSPNSNAYKFATGIMGRKLQPEDDTDSTSGRLYDVVYGPNQDGKLTITSVVKVQMPHSPPRMPQEGRRRGKRHRTPRCRICRSSVDTRTRDMREHLRTAIA